MNRKEPPGLEVHITGSRKTGRLLGKAVDFLWSSIADLLLLLAAYFICRHAFVEGGNAIVVGTDSKYFLEYVANAGGSLFAALVMVFYVVNSDK